jgi:hypothetical protein
VEGAAEGAAESGAEGAAENAASSADEANAARSGHSDEAGAGKESESPSCDPAPHSFAGSTRVLLADGTSKPIDQVKVGDKVKDAVPGEKTTETHTVEKVIVTTTDHDFVDLTIAAPKSPKTTGKLKKAGLALAAGMAALATAGGTATLTTTFHHPFYDKTQAAFVEAADLTPGDDLQTPTGTATVLAKRTYHATAATYDLTINGLHTYYVLAGTTPVLVHNCDLTGAVHAEYGRITTPGSSDYLSISKRGPVLTGVKDEITGDIVTSLNHGTAIEDLHPSLAAQLGRDVGSLYPGGSGIHGEVHGLNELLVRRESARLSTQIDDSFSFYSVRLRGAQQGMPIPPCSVCSRLTP